MNDLQVADYAVTTCGMRPAIRLRMRTGWVVLMLAALAGFLSLFLG
jgi:hypothetical protein